MQNNPDEPETAPVILADVVSSRGVADFKNVRDERLAAISTAHREAGWVAYDYAVTAGDEFQNIVDAPQHVPALVFDLRRRFRPLDLWIAIGLGTIESRPQAGEAVNVAGSGEAFELARAAMGHLRDPAAHPWPDEASSRFARKYTFLTAFRSRGAQVDASVNIIYRLLDSLLQGTTERQWQTIDAYEEHHRLDRAAEKLGIDESTASRNLHRASYWQALDAMVALEDILGPQREVAR